VAQAVRGDISPNVSLNALADSGDRPREPSDSDASVRSASRRYAGTRGSTAPPQADLFDPGTTVRVILMQNVVPILATVGSYLTFLITGAL